MWVRLAGTILFCGIIVAGVLWGGDCSAEPKPPTEATCDEQFEECLKMCNDDPQVEIPTEECVEDCKQEADFCYRLP